MSANLYWILKSPVGELATHSDDPAVHIAQRTKRDGGWRVTWAQDPEAVRRACEANLAVEVALDECDDRWTGADILRFLFGPDCKSDLRMVGEWFA